MRAQPSTRGGMYYLLEDIDMKAKVSTLARRLEVLEMRNLHEVQAVTEIPVPNKPCFICQSTEYLGEQYPTIPTTREMLVEQRMLLVNSNHQLMHHMETLITLAGETTQIFHGSQNLHSMHLLLLHNILQLLSHHN